MLLKNYLPEFIRNVEDIKKITEAEQPEFDNLNDDIDNIQNEMFIETASVNGIERFEKVYEIENKGSEDIDFRKYRLMLKIIGGEHITIAERLDKLIGSGKYAMSFDFDEIRLEIRVNVENKKYVNEAYELLDKIIPCNIILDVGVLYTSHGMIKKYTHKELAEFKHSEIKVMVSL